MTMTRWGTFGPALLLMLALGFLPLANLVYTSFHTVTWAGGQATFTPAGFAALAKPAALEHDFRPARDHGGRDGRISLGEGERHINPRCLIRR